MFAETHRLASPTGASLAYHHAAAQGAPRGTLVVCHGLAEHARRYLRLAQALAAAGYHVYAHDHRGHGETTAADAPPGRFARRDGAEAVVADVVAMRDAAVTRHQGLPVILFGHSMGGLVALNAVMSRPDKFDAVAVWNANFNPGLAGRAAQAILLLEKMLKGSDVPSDLLPRLTFESWGKSIPSHRTPFDWLSRDPAEVARYIEDPLCGFDASVSLWIDLFTLTFRAPKGIGRSAVPKTLPFHLVGGGADPATNGGRAVEWLANHLKKAGFSHISVRKYQEMRHETLNEIGYEAAISDFAAWCHAVSAKS